PRQGLRFHRAAAVFARASAARHACAARANVSRPPATLMLKVLLVEDDPDARDALALLLAESGYDLATASDGLTAVTAAAEFCPDVVVCDWLLPGVDGVT